MTLTDAGYVELGKEIASILKFNPHHDERARFATVDSADKPKDDIKNDRQLAFSGVLIDKRYDEVVNITHCTYSTPVGTFTIEAKGHLACPDIYPAPRF